MRYRTIDLLMCSSLPIPFCAGLFPHAISRGFRRKIGSTFFRADVQTGGGFLNSKPADNMTRDLDKKTGPDYARQLQEKEKAFGCTDINLKLNNGVATGSMTCSEKVGRSIALAGTMKSFAK
jgi:hypothetical protein